MDNGLIFPYPCGRVNGESVILTVLKRSYFPSGNLDVDARDLSW